MKRTIVTLETNNMIQWISALLIIPVFQLLPKEKPLTPSFGILRYLDPFFQTWSDRLMKLGFLENNILTSSRTTCTNAVDYIFGNFRWLPLGKIYIEIIVNIFIFVSEVFNKFDVKFLDMLFANGLSI
ncbi:UNVERIFIED_CONTAM: hypothetical protein NCL1_41375 [Trichonephila clavipes]